MLTTDTAIRNRLDSEYSESDMVLELHEAFTRCRWVSADDMAGVMELAEFFDVGRSTVTNWAATRARTGMPLPIRQLGGTPVYSLHEVAVWWKRWIPIRNKKAGRIPTDYIL